MRPARNLLTKQLQAPSAADVIRSETSEAGGTPGELEVCWSHCWWEWSEKLSADQRRRAAASHCVRRGISRVPQHPHTAAHICRWAARVTAQWRCSSYSQISQCLIGLIKKAKDVSICVLIWEKWTSLSPRAGSGGCNWVANIYNTYMLASSQLYWLSIVCFLIGYFSCFPRDILYSDCIAFI